MKDGGILPGISYNLHISIEIIKSLIIGISKLFGWILDEDSKLNLIFPWYVSLLGVFDLENKIGMKDVFGVRLLIELDFVGE